LFAEPTLENADRRIGVLSLNGARPLA